MKKNIYLLLAAVAIGWCSCNFSTGVKKDLKTGLSYTYNGFTLDEVYLVNADNKLLTNNKVQLNAQVAILVQGLTNYTLKDDKAFPGLSVMVTNKEGSTILNEPDLLAESTGYSTTDAASLRGMVTVADPMKPGETYHMKMRVWDKNNTKNEFNAEVDIVIE